MGFEHSKDDGWQACKPGPPHDAGARCLFTHGKHDARGPPILAEPTPQSYRPHGLHPWSGSIRPKQPCAQASRSCSGPEDQCLRCKHCHSWASSVQRRRSHRSQQGQWLQHRHQGGQTWGSVMVARPQGGMLAACSRTGGACSGMPAYESFTPTCFAAPTCTSSLDLLLTYLAIIQAGNGAMGTLSGTPGPGTWTLRITPAL